MRKSDVRAMLASMAFAITAPVSLAQTVLPWPAESWSQATNLTPVEGPGTNDFYVDLSGAFWNPVTRRLWLCRNGPSDSTSKMWVLAENGSGSFVVDTRSGNRGEWTNFGDFEALTQVDLSQDIIYTMIEGEELIKSFGVSVYGVATPQRVWNTRPYLPLSGGSGAEGIAFVPDAFLRAGRFTDSAGNLYLSARGMHGLMFVGHQNGGRVYAFDLDPNSNAFSFVGAYLTGTPEISELFFDRSLGDLYAWHGDVNRLEKLSFTSEPVGAERRLVSVAMYDSPPGSNGANIEGLTIVDNADGTGSPRTRSLFMTIDGGGSTSLLWFHRFPCTCRADINASGTLSVQDLFDFLALYFANDPRADFNFSGAATIQDLFDFLAAYFAGC